MSGAVVNAGVLLCSLATGLLVIQAVPYHYVPDPPVNPNDGIEAHLEVPPQVTRILNRACANCHSDRTHWPFYARVAPLSWLIAEDVEKGRDSFNLSEWANKTGRRPGNAIGTLLAVCDAVKAKQMPPPKYLLLHHEARLTDTDTADLCAWSAAAVQYEREEMDRRWAATH